MISSEDSWLFGIAFVMQIVVEDRFVGDDVVCSLARSRAH